MPWIDERTWEPEEMVSAGRLNSLLTDNMKMLRYPPTFRARSTEEQVPDQYDAVQAVKIDTILYDHELPKAGDGYFDVALGTYVTSRKGVYAFGAMIALSGSSEDGLLEIKLVNDTTGVTIGRRTSLIAPSGTHEARVGVTTILGCRVNDAVRVDFGIYNVTPGFYTLQPEQTYASVMWGHWIKDWNERSQPWLG